MNGVSGMFEKANVEVCVVVSDDIIMTSPQNDQGPGDYTGGEEALF